MAPPWLDGVRDYHTRTKHHLNRYAAGPEALDWDHQPDPFRRFAGAPEVALPLLGEAAELLHPTTFGAACEPAAVELENLAALLELSLGLSAWKAFGPDRWALRCNPSSGNLHPTEGYVLTRDLPGLADGLYHYAPHDHLLERRCRFETAAEGKPQILVGLSSIAWREAWKYGERAFRYVQLDLGHALGALRYAAALLGWQVRMLAPADPELNALLGLDHEEAFAGAEREAPDLLLAVGPADSLSADTGAWAERAVEWTGRANALGGLPRHSWPAIEEVEEVTRTLAPAPQSPPAADTWPPLAETGLPLARLIRQRRSAQAFDGSKTIPAATLYRLLDALLPRQDTPPWDAWPHAPRLHLALFLHRVDPLPPGLYLLVRGGAEAALRTALRPEFQWERPEGCPDHLPLYRLVAADARRSARTVSCHQDIAATSAFSLGMIAEFEEALGEGPGAYRRLYWEAGLVGHALYLEAEAADLRGTGIGCFFDDTMHEILGLAGHRYQSLYHFTVGHPKSDSRLETLPAYGHLGSSRSNRTQAALKRRIAEVYAQRESMKDALSRGEVARRLGLAQLESLDRELSALDTAFKTLWDAGA